MGHGKETPRQKMIGMMYLVLTALLALNVSKSVLDAFIIIDEVLIKSTENAEKKNESQMSQFEMAKATYGAKAEKWFLLAKETQKKADEIVDYIQDCKIEIVNLVDGPDNLAVTKEKEVQMKFVNVKDNLDIPGEIMIVKGRGKEVRNKIKEMREFLLSKIDPKKGSAVIAAIEKGLDTEDPPQKGGVLETWMDEHFNHMPLAGVVSVMSGIQANVRNAESEALRYFYNAVGAGDLKVNKLDGVVLANSNYIISGNEYSAEVFMAASDSTQKPIVYLGSYETINTPDGPTYKMKAPFDSIKDVIGGKATYKIRPSRIGPTKWGGLIRIKNEDGDKYIPFQAEYQVAQASLVVSPSKMNVFYIGVDNPVDVSVPGVPGDKVYPSISNGTIRKNGNAFVVNVNTVGTANVSVTADLNGTRRPMGNKEFRVKKVPDPVAKVGTIKISGISTKEALLAQYGVMAELENFDFELKFNIVSYTLSAVIGGFEQAKGANSAAFTNDQKNIIKGVGKNGKIRIEDIMAVPSSGTDKSPRRLGNITITIK